MITRIKIEWDIDDVFTQAANDEVSLSEIEASEVLKLLESEHDANIGINWDVISFYIKQVKREEK